MEDTVKNFCSIIFDVLSDKGVKDIICSPGSRNVPLLIAAASRQNLKKHFVADERSAAFMALGISLVSKRPSVLICTSGTALLNYTPAIAEAYYQGIPLIVISADRPVQWIDQDDSQTLRQDGVMENFVKKSFSIPAWGDEDKELQWYVNRIANEAFLTANDRKPGPVHINIHLGEPLGEKSFHEPYHQRLIEVITPDTLGNKEIIKGLARKIAGSRTLLVSGFGLPNAEIQKAVGIFSRQPNVVVMAETISNLHIDNKDYMIDAALTAFDKEYLDNMAPDIVISMGGALVSRKLKEYLRRNKKTCQHWSVGFAPTVSDPFTYLSLKIELEPGKFFKALNSSLRKYPVSEQAKDFKEIWSSMRRQAAEVKDRFIKESPWSELKAFDLILKNLPSNYNLFLSNGTSVRYAQLISYDMPHASYCNRGVSGIDGSTSTAIGGAIEYKGPTVLITGDLSFAYDLGALNIHEIPESFKVIVIDNQGGGIFRFIPTTSELSEREEYLCQQPVLPLKNLAEGYGWHYFECDSEKLLYKYLSDFFKVKGKAIMKISCPGQESAEILKDYMDCKVR